MKRIIVLVLSVALAVSCTIRGVPEGDNGPSAGGTGEGLLEDAGPGLIDENGLTIGERILVPAGFERVEAGQNSFAEYLRDLPLKPHGAVVLYYNGLAKTNTDVYEAVVDMDIGKRDLQQCADAVMRLRGEYLYRQGRYDEIHFNLTNGFQVDYSKWAEGYRVAVEGNNARWIKKTQPSNTYRDFRGYMDLVFAYAGTLSLSRELESVAMDGMMIGDVIIQGGSPGHAVIVVDMAENKDTGERLFLLAQSYMPAQDIHILKNPGDAQLSPWYRLDSNDKLHTPQWTFDRGDVKRF